MCVFGCIPLPSTITHPQSELIYYRIKLFTSAKRIPSIIVIAKIYQNSSPLQSRLGMTSNLSSGFLGSVSNKKDFVILSSHTHHTYLYDVNKNSECIFSVKTSISVPRYVFIPKIELWYMVNPLTCCTEKFKRSHDKQRAYQSCIAC